MTVLYSTIILISREDIFFHQGTFLDTISNISGCHTHTDTNETRKPLIFARRAWEEPLLFRTRYFIDFTSIEEDPKDFELFMRRAWSVLFLIFYPVFCFIFVFLPCILFRFGFCSGKEDPKDIRPESLGRILFFLPTGILFLHRKRGPQG